jgi:hypothetical protein
MLGEETPRTVFVSEEVRDIVWDDYYPDTWEGRRHGNLRAFFDAFTEGAEFSVAFDPFNKPRTTTIARVHPVDLEVFDFRCLDPKPGIRALGFFAEIDTFIALTWDYRENFEGKDDWSEEVKNCVGLWQKLFGQLPPHKGNTVNDYISYNAYAV